MLKQWSSAFIIENCGDPDRFISCRRYLITSYVQFQGCTNNLSISRTQGPETKLPEPRGGPPHGTPRLAWSPMWVSATPLPFSRSSSTGINHFQSKSQLIYWACWFPMALSNQVVSLDQRLRQRTVLNKIIPRTTSLASAHNIKNKPFPWLKWELD